jgi:hypothetical protein
VAYFAAYLLAAFVFKSDDFRAADLLQEFAYDSAFGDVRGAYFSVIAVMNKEDVLKLDFVIGGRLKELNFDNVVFLHSILFSTAFDNRVHEDPPIILFFEGNHPPQSMKQIRYTKRDLEVNGGVSLKRGKSLNLYVISQEPFFSRWQLGLFSYRRDSFKSLKINWLYTRIINF